MIKSINIIDLQNKLAKNLISILNQEIETTKKLLSNFIDKESTQRASILRLRNSLVYETVNYLNSELEIDVFTLEEDDYEQYLHSIHGVGDSVGIHRKSHRSKELVPHSVTAHRGSSFH